VAITKAFCFMKTVLVSQSFGKETEYRRAVLAILSAFCFLNETEKSELTVVLFTDNSAWFEQWLSDIHVVYIPLTPEKITSMRGELNFLHRMKIALIEETFDLFPNQVLFYIDSDTCFQGSFIPIAQSVSSEKAYMHLIEYPFKHLDNPLYSSEDPFYKFYHHIVNQPLQGLKNETFFVRDDHFSYNAGIMCFHPTHRALIPLVYQLTDAIYTPTLNHASEQYAFSLAFQWKKQLGTIDSIVFHYWHRVQKQIMDERLSKTDFLQLEQLTFDEKKKHLARYIAQLPTEVAQHPLMLLDQLIQDLNCDQFRSAYWKFLSLSFRSPRLAMKNCRHVLYHTKRFLIHK
jgi:hypothetical protein